jgi:hypothetical protein
MNSKLKAMIVSVGVFTLGGVGFYVYTPQPATRTMLELRDAGLADGQKFVLICPERLTQRTKNRINRTQPGVLRPKQSYARVARLSLCFNPDGGNCFRPSDGLLRVADLEGEVVVPSLRRDVVGTVEGDDGGEDEVDDSLQYRFDACSFLTCNQADTAQDAGTFVNPYANGFCGALNRLAVQPLPNMIPDCRGPDGGWDDEAGEVGHIAAPNCKFGGPYGLPDGGPRWAGCNSYPAQFASGNQCLPVESSVVSGDLINSEWL